jgi:uncharacterized protein YlxW (UPF0749 family)
VDYIHLLADTFVMAVALKEMERPMQDGERIARLEAHVEHIQSDVTDLKLSVRKLSEIVNELKTQIDARFEKMNGQLEVRFAKLNKSRALDKVWWSLSMASLLAVMARGFKWI